ncbi:unnamed protein product [Medioppia subpectinata]|uniref:Polycomb protein SUZ12 n=1 Tax=Medioppia subpectinata TaxID=1979941 RepID=A0A7R9PUA9_9ACAR|nr:unnamed protein product [Medioppia subpectinata]CAG2101578.1 unnamed protein product [Medioppia subpectinata]
MSGRRRGRSQDSASDWSIGSIDKDNNKVVDKFNDRHNCQENESFWQTFEKPTQIYRYLRTRHLVSPIFLNRNLYYMRQRFQRSNGKKRRDFSIDNILQYVIEKKQREAIAEESAGNLTLTILSVKNQSSNKDHSAVTVETSLLKMGHQKRKDVLAPVYQYSVGTTELELNGEDSDDNCLTVYKSELNETNGHLVKQWSYSLLFIASFHKDYNQHKVNGNCVESDKQENDMSLMNDNNPKSEPLVKRRRLDEPTVTYFKAELIIYDKHKNCLLTDGEYTAVLQPCAPPKANKFGKYSKYSKWQEITAEDIDGLSIEDPNKQYGSMEVFRKGPVLMFKLSWSSSNNPANDSLNGMNHILSNNIENDSGIGNNTSDNSSNQSFNGCLPTDDALKAPLNSLSLLGHKKPVRVIYQFMFNNNVRQQTKPQSDLCCPWCSLNCQQLYSLIKHLKLCHNRFVFNYVPDAKCARIDVAVNECYDGSYAGNPLDLSFNNTGFAFSRNGPVRRNPVTHVIVCHPKRFPQSLSEFDEPDDEDGTNGRTYISGHNRLYYHTNSCLPIRPQEMEYDSEAENDPKWMKEKTQMMIDEFTDVNEGEKEVMKMWNLHIMSNGVDVVFILYDRFVGDCQIQLACDMFVKEKGEELFAKNLYKNFILHLNNLYDFGLLNASSFVDIIKNLNQKQKCLAEEQKGKALKTEPNNGLKSR